jgi:enterochelin esterase-like enzyme
MKNIWPILIVALLNETGMLGQTPIPQPVQTNTNATPRRSGGRDPKMDAHYKLGPDSMPQQDVPKGRIDGPKVIQSEVFPGTQHTYWVYVPAQYDPAQPTALIIFNDGQAFKNEPGDVQAHHVLDNLIYRREIPVMLGVFINPGRRPDQPEPTPQSWGDRDTNRPEEYNALNDKYPRVIVDELLPALRKDYNISINPEDRAIGGASSGGIAAFTVAWHRPDHFRKVFSFVGSFVNLGNRMGHTYPDIVLQSEKKPLRVYLQDGRNDNRSSVRAGNDPNSVDWFYQNVRMADALTRKGYDLNYTWGIGNHGQKQGGAIFPEIMRWLWRDAQPVSTDRNDAIERSFRPPAPQPATGSATSAP